MIADESLGPNRQILGSAGSAARRSHSTLGSRSSSNGGGLRQSRTDSRSRHGAVVRNLSLEDLVGADALKRVLR